MTFDFWPWTYAVYHLWRDETLYQILTQTSKQRRSYWRFSTFSPCNFRRWGTTDRRFSGVRGPNFSKRGKDIGRLRLHNKFVSEFGYLAVFSNASGSKLSDVENDAKFRTFWKLGEGWARSLDCWSFSYDRTSGIYTVSQKTSPTFLAITRESIDGFL